MKHGATKVKRKKQQESGNVCMYFNTFTTARIFAYCAVGPAPFVNARLRGSPVALMVPSDRNSGSGSTMEEVTRCQPTM